MVQSTFAQIKDEVEGNREYELTTFKIIRPPPILLLLNSNYIKYYIS